MNGVLLMGQLILEGEGERGRVGRAVRGILLDCLDMKWSLADAKNRFSEVVERALTEGPQYVSRRGEDVVVVLSVADFEQLSAERKPFGTYLLSAPGGAEESPAAPYRVEDIPGLIL